MSTSTFASWSEWVESGQWADGSDAAMPMLPALAADVMSLAIDPEVSVARIARVIAKDQVLATRVLRLANSAYCAPMQEVTTVNDAIVRMGTGPVRNVVLAVCFTSRLQGANVYGPQGRELMDHAIGTAYLARLVAEKLGEDADEAFMCGLLHDMGKLLLLKLARDFIKFGVPTPSSQEIDTVCRERHAEIGARLLHQWQLPEALESPVRYHHDPAASTTHSRESAVTYMANRLSHRYGFGCPVEEATLVEDPICTRLGLNDAWQADLDKRAPGLFQVARQIVA
jgi:putative nucleotidyltransferase with HDIG domain